MMRYYRAAEWGDLGNSFLWKGRLRIISKGKNCEIRMEDNSTGKKGIARKKEENLTDNHNRRSICYLPI